MIIYLRYLIRMVTELLVSLADVYGCLRDLGDTQHEHHLLLENLRSRVSDLEDEKQRYRRRDEFELPQPNWED